MTKTEGDRLTILPGPGSADFDPITDDVADRHWNEFMNVRQVIAALNADIAAADTKAALEKVSIQKKPSQPTRRSKSSDS